MSPRQIRNGEIISAVRDALMQSGLSAGSLELEITEGLIVDHASETSEILERLHEIGCHVVQGYLFGKPLTAEDFEALFSASGPDGDKPGATPDTLGGATDFKH